eukprot:13376499-Alexandrium_andersonii.AAC.1
MRPGLARGVGQHGDAAPCGPQVPTGRAPARRRDPRSSTSGRIAGKARQRRKTRAAFGILAGGVQGACTQQIMPQGGAHAHSLAPVPLPLIPVLLASFLPPFPPSFLHIRRSTFSRSWLGNCDLISKSRDAVVQRSCCEGQPAEQNDQTCFGRNC